MKVEDMKILFPGYLTNLSYLFWWWSTVKKEQWVLSEDEIRLSQNEKTYTRKGCNSNQTLSLTVCRVNVVKGNIISNCFIMLYYGGSPNPLYYEYRRHSFFYLFLEYK